MGLNKILCGHFLPIFCQISVPSRFGRADDTKRPGVAAIFFLQPPGSPFSAQATFGTGINTTGIEKICMGKIPGIVLLYISLAALLVLALSSAGCTSGQPEGAHAGDTVHVTYTLKLEDGTVFESNVNGTPLVVEVGSGKVIPGLDEALVGMSPGQTKTATIPPEKAYGVHRSELVSEISTLQGVDSFWKLRESGLLQPYMKPGFDSTFIWQNPEDGRIGYVTFSNITDTTMTVDENHPLAGKTLIYEITMLDIVTPETSSP